LTVPEQQSDTDVREFWVGLEEPYPIYYCRYRDAHWVYWQLEVDYRVQDGRLVPAAWTGRASAYQRHVDIRTSVRKSVL
jgi:hypothetical protein